MEAYHLVILKMVLLLIIVQMFIGHLMVVQIGLKFRQLEIFIPLVYALLKVLTQFFQPEVVLVITEVDHHLV